MLKRNAKKWVEALRSGEYEQCVGRLQKDKGFCCLGVACSVYEKETGKTLPRDDKGFYKGSALVKEFEEVNDWLGLKDPQGVGTFLDHGVGTCLTLKNDMDGLTFKQIADLIESKPSGLFE